MAILVLLSSTGFGFIEHQCMMRGKSVQFVSEKKSKSCKPEVATSCCAKSKAAKEQSGTYLKKTDCCKDNQKFTKLEVASSQNVLFAKVAKAMPLSPFLPANIFDLSFTRWVHAHSHRLQDILSFSSRFHGRSMRSFIQSFLI
jgi:hypothetical protein